MPNAIVKNTNIYYELHGRGEPLVFISGFSCDHTFWTALLDKLANHFQVLIFDNRAIGRTKDSGQSFTLETMAEDTVMLIQQLGLKRPHIVGQSMGGMIAQFISSKYPDMVNKQIILNSTTKINTATLMIIEGFIKLFKDNVSLEHIIEISIPWFYSSQFLSNPKNVATLKSLFMNNPYPQSLIDFERQYNAIKLADTKSSLDKINSPTHIVIAENDFITLPNESYEIKQNISDATLSVIPGGHSSPVEQPQRVSEEILKFLTK